MILYRIRGLWLWGFIVFVALVCNLENIGDNKIIIDIVVGYIFGFLIPIFNYLVFQGGIKNTLYSCDGWFYKAIGMAVIAIILAVGALGYAAINSLIPSITYIFCISATLSSAISSTLSLKPICPQCEVLQRSK